MSNRTWACVPCCKSYRRVQSVAAVACPHCHEPCEYLDWKMRVPSPRKVKEWEGFWVAYRAEQALLATHRRGELREAVVLRLLGMAPRERKSPDQALQPTAGTGKFPGACGSPGGRRG